MVIIKVTTKTEIKRTWNWKLASVILFLVRLTWHFQIRTLPVYAFRTFTIMITFFIYKYKQNRVETTHINKVINFTRWARTYLWEVGCGNKLYITRTKNMELTECYYVSWPNAVPITSSMDIMSQSWQKTELTMKTGLTQGRHTRA